MLHPWAADIFGRPFFVCRKTVLYFMLELKELRQMIFI